MSVTLLLMVLSAAPPAACPEDGTVACRYWTPCLEGDDGRCATFFRLARKASKSELLVLADALCEQGRPSACAESAKLRRREGVDDGKNPRDGLRRGCDLDGTLRANPACLELALALLDERSGPRDEGKAAALFDQQCALGSDPACRQAKLLAADRAWAGKRAAPTERPASCDATCAAARCRAGDLGDCQREWRFAREGDGIEAGRRVRIAQCELGLATACEAVGNDFIYREPRDLTQAIEWLGRGCGMGLEPSCFDQRFARREQAIEAHVKAGRCSSKPACIDRVFCELEGDAQHCRNDLELGVRDGHADAVTKVEAACGKGEGWACAVLGRAPITVVAPERAATFLRRACELGLADACLSAGLPSPPR